MAFNSHPKRKSTFILSTGQIYTFGPVRPSRQGQRPACPARWRHKPRGAGNPLLFGYGASAKTVLGALGKHRKTRLQEGCSPGVYGLHKEEIRASKTREKIEHGYFIGSIRLCSLKNILKFSGSLPVQCYKPPHIESAP